MCVVTTFYTLEGMKSLFLPKFVFFSFKATPFSQKHKFIILLFYLVFTSVALRIITYPAPSRREPLYVIISADSGLGLIPDGAWTSMRYAYPGHERRESGKYVLSMDMCVIQPT